MSDKRITRKFFTFWDDYVAVDSKTIENTKKSRKSMKKFQKYLRKIHKRAGTKECILSTRYIEEAIYGRKT